MSKSFVVCRKGWIPNSILPSAQDIATCMRRETICAIAVAAINGSAFATTTFHRITFDPDSSALRPDAVAILHEGAEIMKRDPTLVARIEGSACASEKDADHLWYERATTSKIFLIQHGVPAGQITVIAKANPAWQAEIRRVSQESCSEYEGQRCSWMPAPRDEKSQHTICMSSPFATSLHCERSATFYSPRFGLEAGRKSIYNKGGSMRIFPFAAIAGLLLAGCATTKDWAATGGSRSDGVVRLSYEVGEFEKPQLNEQQAIGLATQRCKTWGYSGAEAFGGVTRQCNQGGGFGGCSRWMVTKEYQCTGTGTPTSP